MEVEWGAASAKQFVHCRGGVRSTVSRATSARSTTTTTPLVRIFAVRAVVRLVRLERRRGREANAARAADEHGTRDWPRLVRAMSYNWIDNQKKMGGKRN